MRSTRAQSGFGRSGRTWASGAAPVSIRFAVSSSEPFQNGWKPASASQSITPTAQMSADGSPGSPRSRSGGTYASVPGTSPVAVSDSSSASWARPKSSSRTEISSPSATRMLEGLTSRWTTPRLCAWASASSTCAAASTAAASFSSPARSACAHGLAGDVLVGDVDVAAVALERVGAQTVLVAQARSCKRLALGSRRGLALARDDLQRDVEAVALVAGEPDRARAAAAERPERPVAVDDELACGERQGRLGHDPQFFARFGRILRPPGNSLEWAGFFLQRGL